MSPTPSLESVIILWVMQFLFVTPWLVLAIGISVMALVFHKFDKIAKSLQKGPIEVGIKGLPRIVLNQATIGAMIFVLRTFTSVAIFLGTTTTYIIAYLFKNKVQMEAAKLPDEYMALGEEPSIDFIILCGLVGITITITIAIAGFSALRRKGQVVLQQSGEKLPTSLIAHLYGRTTLAGIVIIVIGCYPLWALVMNLIWGFAVVIPLPPSLVTIDLPGTDFLLIVMFGVISVGVAFAMTSPTIMLTWRGLMMSFRQYMENRIVHATSITLMAIMLGLFGGLITMGLLSSIGEALFPDMFH